MASISSVTDLAVPKAEEHSQIDVSAYDVMGRMVLVESRSVLRTSTTTDVIAVIQPVYVSLTRCQHAQMFLSLFHTNPYRYQYRESVHVGDRYGPL